MTDCCFACGEALSEDEQQAYGNFCEHCMSLNVEDLEEKLGKLPSSRHKTLMEYELKNIAFLKDLEAKP